MTSPKDTRPQKRSKVAEQALQVLRDTRAKMDPDLLMRMKTLLAPLAKPQPPAAAKGLANKAGLFAPAPKEQEPPKPSKEATSAEVANLYGNASHKTFASQKQDGPEMVPVDRQKIAKIVMKYMELREEKKPGN